MPVRISYNDAEPARQADTVPFYRVLPMLARGPVDALAELGRQARGEALRLDLGPFRPYLLTHPEHVQRVLRGNSANYVREGMLWKPLRRLFGTDGILGEGPAWKSSRTILQPLFTARYVASLAEQMADAIAERIDGLDEFARSGRSIDAAEEMTDIVMHATARVLFGDKISPADGRRLAPTFDTLAASMGFRMLMPFMPYSVPLPGDRAFMNAVKAIDEVVYPLIRKARAQPDDGSDIISALCRAHDEDQAGDRQVRDDLVSIFLASTDTTAMSLTWLWPVLHAHPAVAARLYDEVDRVVGAGPARPSHVPELRYTKMVLQELIRLHPPGWVMPRMAVVSDDIGGVRIKAGSIVVTSPYATHRLDEFWERPLDFDPERFSPDIAERRHRYSYFPFGGGPHQCLGQYLFYIEAPLAVATILSRFRPVVRNPGPFTPLPSVALRPKQKIELGLVPVERTPPRPR
ncbi:MULTISPECIES: cytochrome P450 [Streptosporangium]|uniref:Cytochrome P450 n=1 Tax=Streptosporangium brasiliense TaxID=47480 RepID=A0ABT9REY7_9ACTN|nr:cytochrome P450 [Streptosporangium brasiliense]MDP9867825.1 cytochrome P450 [Streptosporangium brasiliense]